MIYSLLCGNKDQDEVLNECNASILYEELPKGIKGFVFSYDNVNFIIVHKYLGIDKKKETIIHELAHIELNQLGNYDKDLFAFKIDEYEDEADNYIEMIQKRLEEIES